MAWPIKIPAAQAGDMTTIIDGPDKDTSTTNVDPKERKKTTGAITYLAFLQPKSKQAKETSPGSTALVPAKATTTTSSSNGNALNRLLGARQARVTKFFEQKRAQATATDSSSLTSKIFKVFTLFSRKKTFKSVVMMHNLQRTMKSMRDGKKNTSALAEAILLRQKEERHLLAIGRWRKALSAVVFQNEMAKKKRLKKQQTKEKIIRAMATNCIEKILRDSKKTMAAKIFKKRQTKKIKLAVIFLQRMMRKLFQRRAAYQLKKSKMLDLLTLATSQVQQEEQKVMYTTKAIEFLTSNLLCQVCDYISRKRACMLIQKTWRGFKGRKRFQRLWSIKKRRELKRLHRQRLRVAREVLISPTYDESARRQMLQTRIEARREKHFMTLETSDSSLGSTSYLMGLYPSSHALTEQETSLFRTFNNPPRVSTATGGRVQRLPFRTFERMRTTDAHVNPHNVWVAIPVHFQEKCTDLPIETSKNPFAWIPHDSPLRPLRLIDKKPTPGRIRPPRTREGKGKYYDTQFDWVPATLLDGGRISSPTLKERYERSSPWRKNRPLSPLQSPILPTTITNTNTS